MNGIKVERLDHLGVVASVIKDLEIMEMIGARIAPDEQEKISTGEAVAAMILNGLGFSNRPLYLTPQYFHNKPVDALIREGVSAEHLNHYKLGRGLDDVFDYGCDLLFSEIGLHVCEKEGINNRFNSLDTTTFSLTGEYLPDGDEQAILITHGYSKDHRPDLKQATLELIVSQDGGVPFFSKAWDGNESDNEIFKARSKALIEQLQASQGPRYVVADSKLYTEENSANLAKLFFITRIPGTLKVESEVIDQAWKLDEWKPAGEGYQYQSIRLGHYGMDQRWVIVFSKAARDRAETTLVRAREKESEKIDKQLFHLQAQRFESIKEAHSSLDKIVKKMKYHKLEHFHLIPHIQYARRGKPTPHTPIKAVKWQLQASVIRDEEKILQQQQRKACFVLATNEKREKQLPDEEVLSAYKGQSSVEGGFRFLKEPLFFTSSLFVKKPSRMQALLMVMTLALLVYSVAQRRLRKGLEKQQETLPDQLGQPTATPTLRWIFQLLDGIHRVTVYIQDQAQVIIEGLTELKRKVLRFFGQKVCQLYQISYT